MMNFKGFKRKKKRKYPVKRDESGKTARSRCFEIFPDNTPLDEIARTVDVKIETVRRYHRQWKENPNLNKQYAYLKKLLKKTAPDRERTIELCSHACGITQQEFENVLSKPHGLRRLMTGKYYFPGHAAADHKLYMALEVAMTVLDHLYNNRGTLADVLFAFNQWMKEYQIYREGQEEEMQKENKMISFTHQVLAAAAEQERRQRIPPDRLSDEEQEAIIRYEIDSTKKKRETLYWKKIAALMAEGLTKDQAREKIYQDILNNGNVAAAKALRKYQDIIHPLKSDKQPPPAASEPPKSS